MFDSLVPTQPLSLAEGGVEDVQNLHTTQAV